MRNRHYITDHIPLYTCLRYPGYIFVFHGEGTATPVAVTEEDLTMLSLQYRITDMSQWMQMDPHFNTSMTLLDMRILPDGYDYGT